MSSEISKILIVEDEKRIRDLLKLYLLPMNYHIDETDNGFDGLTLALTHSYAAIILDVILPSMDGFQICKELRQYQNTPILILSAKSSEEDRIKGFEAGADDYVIKPFSPRELTYRVQSIMRNHKNQVLVSTKKEPALTSVYFTLNDNKIFYKDQMIHLTPKEYELLYYLAASPNKLFSRADLLHEVWQYEFIGDVRTVDTHIKRLRNKLSLVSPEAASSIQTVWGFGYKFLIEDRIQ